MEWNKGFTGAFYASEVDPETWKDINRFEITGGQIDFTNEGLRNSADIDCVDYNQDREIWVRVWLDARQTGDSDHSPLFTGLACAPDKDVKGTLTTRKVKCYSVLQPCESVLLPRGWYAPAGTSADIILRDLLSKTPAPVIIEGNTPKLLESIVSEEGENHLTMTEKVLAAIGWRLRVTGNGSIIITPKADESMLTISKDYDIIETAFSESYDWYTAPNVFRAVTDNTSVTVKDESDGPLSIKNRGREIWMEETGCNLNQGESLRGYAERRLKEEQKAVRKVSYTRRFVPGLYPTDILQICYPPVLDGKFSITSQTITLEGGASVSEEVEYGQS